MVIRNYLYNLMYQIITIILPIITTPYVSRILGADGIGKYSLTSTYAQYFVLFGMIGLGMYCSREIAYVRDDKYKLSKIFWELNFLRFITMGTSVIIYILFCVYIIKPQEKSGRVYFILGRSCQWRVRVSKEFKPEMHSKWYKSNWLYSRI